MENNISVRRSGNTALDLALIEKEKIAAFTIILGYTILIISANKERNILIQREQGIEPQNESEPTRLVVLSSIMTLLANILLGDIAYSRLRELEKNISSGESKFSIIPNLNITRGYSIIILGNILKTIGVIQRAQEQAQITVL
ncbi:hypothetical protein [Clostridium manihotivorum]|uniref:Uncharacterized protein n=1 Tax=Clostridium manihotivorum TaxID=2320868 RepID=A0A410DTW6_9CLOT|nr:hypothetical protein [Clostridium manihotivorum]QAA32526.1 hypothetical protein C1I91_13290 [Clostridium manihotivorum]